MLCKSMDRGYNTGIYKNFLKGIATIFSTGCHKIFDIWYFVSKKPEIPQFALKKRFDFM